jgi:FtsH-binding integral membrane protein
METVDPNTLMSEGNNPRAYNDLMYGSKVAHSHIKVRLGFLRKVYIILAAQLTFTTLICFIIMISPSLSGFVKE